jgi:uncharacterized protein YbbC (DUF1343 family)
MGALSSQEQLALGIDRFAEDPRRYVRDERVALLCHAASVDRDYRHLTRIASEAGLNVTRCFGPEHGIWAEAQDMEPVTGEQVEPTTGAPVTSLYGHELSDLTPDLELLRDVDVMIIDLQDIGARYYTYIYTACLCIQQCALTQTRVLILDRPNPLGGVEVEGRYTHPDFCSFVGLWPLPTRHGLTIGEVARLINHREGWGAELEVLEVRGWSREQLLSETGQRWVIPSPNMPSFEAMLVYPGMCLIEGTELSEARGTTKPFEWVGAGFINPFEWCEELNSLGVDGVTFRPLYYKPTFHKWAGQTIGGAHLHVTDPHAVRPLRLGLQLLGATRRVYGDQLRWRTQAYEFVKDRLAIDLLFGDDEARPLIDSGASVEELDAYWSRCQLEATRFKEERAPFLLY